MGTLNAARTVEIDAPLDRCYEIIADLPSTPEWQDSMVSLEALETDADGRVTRAKVASDAKVRQVEAILSFRHSPPDGMSWEQEKGELKWMRGSWKLVDLGEGRTEATYSLEADPGRMLGLLLRGPVEDKVKEFLTKDAAEGLKRRAEGS